METVVVAGIPRTDGDQDESASSEGWAVTAQSGTTFIREVPRQERLDVAGRFAPRGSAGFQIPREPQSRIDLPELQRRQDGEHHRRQTTGPFGSRAVVVLATQRRIAHQTLSEVVVQRNAWIIEKHGQARPMFHQAGQYFAAGLAEFRVSQFCVALLAHGGHMLTQSGIDLSVLGR